LHETLPCRNPSVLVWRKQAHLVVVLVDRLSVVPPLLLIPPVRVGVTELPLDGRRVDVAAVLRGKESMTLAPHVRRGSVLTIPGSSASVRVAGSGYLSSMRLCPVTESGRKVRCWMSGTRRAARVVVRMGAARTIRRDSICFPDVNNRRLTYSTQLRRTLAPRMARSANRVCLVIRFGA
jgi:hypothetical protein